MGMESQPLNGMASQGWQQSPQAAQQDAQRQVRNIPSGEVRGAQAAMAGSVAAEKNPTAVQQTGVMQALVARLNDRLAQRRLQIRVGRDGKTFLLDQESGQTLREMSLQELEDMARALDSDHRESPEPGSLFKGEA